MSQDSPSAGRILIFVVAYQAKDHIRATLSRIPKDVLARDDVDLLVIDDASSDGSIEIARDWAREHHLQRVRLIRNPVNQGYGGNQKLGYRLAIDEGYGFVILLHGDGQYAPEMLPRFIEEWRIHSADVVLGTRMGSIRAARSGNMPWHKVLGNRFLTGIQNRLTGKRLSEYHTGFRGYSTSLLRSIPFEMNTNDFHFDTEILLQAFHVHARIREFDIPTHYGDEISRVKVVRYGLSVILATLRYRMHQLGMMVDLKFRDLSDARDGDRLGLIYSAQRMVLDIVRRSGVRRVLDLGCAPGHIVAACQELGLEVVGVDRRLPQPGKVIRFHRMDLDTDPFPFDPWNFDLVLLLDVIEELSDPERFLVRLRNESSVSPQAARAPLVVITTPNVAFIMMRINLLLGRFNYSERGILDTRHKRLFTRSSLVRTLRDCGYRIESIRPVPVPFSAVAPGYTGRFLTRCSELSARLWPSLLAFQFLVTARPMPGVRQVLLAGEKHSAADEPSMPTEVCRSPDADAQGV
jgi:glycosyltransferase involved in cell wall biosynthesis